MESGREGRREGRREGGKEGRRDGGREGRNEGETEGGRVCMQKSCKDVCIRMCRYHRHTCIHQKCMYVYHHKTLVCVCACVREFRSDLR
jgi:hypothetical protein